MTLLHTNRLPYELSFTLSQTACRGAPPSLKAIFEKSKEMNILNLSAPDQNGPNSNAEAHICNQCNYEILH